MDISLDQVGGWIVAGGGLIAAVWGGIQRYKTGKANTRADVAEANASRDVADAQSTVYTTLTSRLESLENEIKGIRAELSVERQHSRKLELHIFKLENLMRQANLTPPVFGASEA